jgi:uncharacterized protein (UPF0332 family)
VTPQAYRFLEKADKLLNQAETMLRVGLNEAAGRTAYLAGYHAAQALIFERTGKAFKSHGGVQTEFLRLTKSDHWLDGHLRVFLSRTYNLKAIADYDTDSEATVSNERAALAIESGKQFVKQIILLITNAGRPQR